jgi:hypothetical protein
MYKTKLLRTANRYEIRLPNGLVKEMRITRKNFFKFKPEKGRLLAKRFDDGIKVRYNDSKKGYFLTIPTSFIELLNWFASVTKKKSELIYKPNNMEPKAHDEIIGLEVTGDLLTIINLTEEKESEAGSLMSMLRHSSTPFHRDFNKFQGRIRKVLSKYDVYSESDLTANDIAKEAGDKYGMEGDVVIDSDNNEYKLRLRKKE